jgi:hypothetical protein
MQNLHEDGEPCAYRGDDGLMCVAGCLIADNEYDLGMEQRGWDNLAMHHKVPAEHRNLIASLQSVHDNNEPQWWEGMLENVALKYKLTFIPA